MIPTRAIPVLLLSRDGLVKTIRFRDRVYLGDPINIVRIFNEKEVDELVLLDIDATKSGASPDVARITDIVSEAFMPVCYGGGVRTIEQMRALYMAGIEKVSLNSIAAESPEFVEEAAREFGSSSVVVSMDVRRRMLGGNRVAIRGASVMTKWTPGDYARRMSDAGAGEIMLNSVERDGTQSGYDIELIQDVSARVSIPVIACGGARTVDDLGAAVAAGASAAGAGSMFVFNGPHRAVLISYPSPDQLRRFFSGR